MAEIATTICLIVLTALSSAAGVLAFARLGPGSASRSLRKIQYSLTGICVTGAALLFLYRAVYFNEGWRPLGAHVDGLLLISTLFAAAILFVQRAAIRGLSVFALPLLTIMLAWGICANAFTYEPFDTRSMWMVFHQASVYLGLLFFCIAATAGALYLFVQHRLHTHRPSDGAGPMASLESVERLNIRAATIGFALLTVALITGLIIQTSAQYTRLGEGWWYSPKVLLAAAVWLISAIVMNVRFATTFRGARAAWLSIAGLILLLATFVAANVLPDLPRELDDGLRTVHAGAPENHRE